MAFFELKHRIDEGVYQGWPIDWGAWGARVKKHQVLEFIQHMSAQGAGASYELVSFVHALGAETDYALVASEL
jgi:hypothetical protein